jgi:uncharacterized protein (TIGR02268 family)
VPHLPCLCLLLTLTSASAALAQAQAVDAAPEDAPSWEVPTRHIPLRAEPSQRTAHRVQVSPGKATVLLFDTPLARVELQDERRFGRVRLHEDTLMLVPSPRLAEGAQVPLVAYFRDGAAPTSADFLLVVHTAVAERQVNVTRQPRPADSLYAELGEKDARIQQLTAEVERLRGERHQPGGLVGALIAGHMGEGGVPALDLSEQVKQRPRNALGVRSVAVLRGLSSVALRVELELVKPVTPHSVAPWQVEGAVLVGGDGGALPVLRVLQQEPIEPGDRKHVFVEVAAAPATAVGPYTLTLWAAGGIRSVVLGNIVFPSMP